jgi:RNA polymerase sigma-70 factor (ECF subfamily)
MTGDGNEVRDVNASPNCGCTPTPCVAVAAWRIKATCGRSDEDVRLDEVGHNPDRYSNAPEDLLLIAAQSGDHQAFVELCRRHSAMVKKKIFSIVRNQEDTEDVLQDTLLRAFRHLPAFRRACKFSSWFMTIGLNTALMMLRKRKTQKEGHTGFANEDGTAWDVVEFVDASHDPEYLPSRNQVIFLMRQEIERLKLTLRSMIQQHYGTECSLEESAKALDISLGAAKSRLMRGRKTLRSYLKRHGISDSRVH